MLMLLLVWLLLLLLVLLFIGRAVPQNRNNEIS